ncbi:SIMPL domain-containing protein [Daejeonella sp.]|jgi:uncharacterized protein YggE|uniref:SIMPL domain-containing protein n=1 Tax=Daejeonella sp. TaxID=2805397 RepID=UPI0037C0049F
MKKIILLAIIGLFSLSASSQQMMSMPKKIEVSGSAEAEVTPDILYIAISLKEYFKDASNKNKVDIEYLERQLQTAVLKAGIPQENFMINNITSYNNWWNKKKVSDFLASKQYRIKLSDLNKFNEIMSAIDPKGLESSNIESYEYSKIESLKKELKIKALQNAKEKAEYLTQSIGASLVGPLEIQEMNNEPQVERMMYAKVMMSDTVEEMMPEIDFKKIKLNFQIRAVFEIK